MKIFSKLDLNNYDQSLTYDDISLVPCEISRIKSRKEAKTETTFLGRKLLIPVIASPMDSVTGIVMAEELNEMGCIGIVNRFDSSLEKLSNVSDHKISAVSISLNHDEKIIEKFAERDYIICIDTANANNKTVLEKCESIKKKYNTKVIVGNVAQGSSLSSLVDAGADAVRIGIGGGSMCTTSIQTGIGIGQASSLLDLYFARETKNLNIELIADGGIKSPGDVAKALALGADVVMLGRMLAGTKEAPGEVIKYNDQLWKKYRGSASFGVKMKNEFIEGEETMIPYKGPVKAVIDSISDGLRSSMSYMNCFNLEELKSADSFAILSHSSYLERLPKK
ncbi:MAG: guanosine monophosphate reductase [Ignavibacteriales bacterium]|nr:guanosine monophosphate reductase [Ignavibacteriales bacterium]MCB9210466.1 guanosine monophosphate reductase [Ignavibacteriales bacterium]MCB9219723.1 guanosine monophosphate reductase [Ignavibacteriales bacterium]